MNEMTSGYIGFDPTADSLHIGNLVPVMMLVHLQRCGHKPFVLVGGATGRVGDPSGKTEERQLLSVDQINHNLNCQKSQLMKFLNFEKGENKAEVVNNFDWFKDFSFLDFIRDVRNHLDRGSKIISSPLFGDHVVIHSTCGEIALLGNF